jgi:hypothetical protein
MESVWVHFNLAVFYTVMANTGLYHTLVLIPATAQSLLLRSYMFRLPTATIITELKYFKDTSVGER